MAEVTLKDITRLREETGAGIMDCKKALIEAGGDFEKAKEILRKKGRELMQLKAGRQANEGVVAILVSDDKKYGVGITLKCETDFVAMNEQFQELAKQIAELAIANKPASLEDLLKVKSGDGLPIEELIGEAVGKIGEKIELGDYALLKGEYVYPYVHYNKKVGTIVAFDKVVPEEVAKNIAMHITAMNPIALDESDVPEEIVQKEKEIAIEQARQQGKPEHILKRIAEGKIKKFYKERTLLNQPLFNNPDLTIRDYLAKDGGGASIIKFKRLSVEE
ncbi:MAG: elongation factor Ts [Chlorobi bacterium]|nr:elongation factor Ts [Chlorobiota bacterium]